MNATTERRPTLFRRLLLLDFATGAITSLALLVAAAPLAELFGLSQRLLVVSAVILLGYATLLLIMQRAERIPRALAWTLIELNLLWVIASFAVAFGGWYAPTFWGKVVVVGQALFVLDLALLQLYAWRREGKVLSAPAVPAPAALHAA
ncbi:hypothetical protein [Tahibacter harae]|uniref:Integral membrane protein n=1 Tax=Tahibacter harae TaxID=2963937 RepID=A0ABT1QNS3_9GAMM|nr:hypothetical protein [Tahibacter harae]MCQ4163895.1 hypothetical protein [Tahibacter harae]